MRMVTTPDILPVFDDRAIVDEGQMFFIDGGGNLKTLPIPAHIDNIYVHIVNGRFGYAYDFTDNDWANVPIPVSPIPEAAEFELFLKMADNVRTVMKGVKLFMSDYLLSSTVDAETGNLSDDYPVIDNKNILFQTNPSVDDEHRMYIIKSYKKVRYTAAS